LRDQPHDIDQKGRQDGLVRGVELFGRPPSSRRVEFVL
jgi:hypothetical protein